MLEKCRKEKRRNCVRNFAKKGKNVETKEGVRAEYSVIMLGEISSEKERKRRKRSCVKKRKRKES